MKSTTFSLDLSETVQRRFVMKLLGILMMGLLVFAFTGMQDVRADQAEEACRTGLKYYKGEGVTQDYAEAMKWFRKAAELSYLVSQQTTGLIYNKGADLTQNYAEAINWFRKAADQGDAIAQVNIGLMYANGEGVTKDYVEAMRWYRKAASQGYAAAQYRIGIMYYGGFGVTQDYTEALKWYQKAADQGDAAAQYDIAMMYLNGDGVTKDYTEAIELYRKNHDDFINSLNNMLKKVDPAAKGIDPAILRRKDVQADKGSAVPVPSEAQECLVLAGEPIFFSESGIEQCMGVMASLMDANESFATGNRAYRDKLHQLVSRKEARILPEDLGVRILERKDYVRGLARLPGVKILVLDPVTGKPVWVFLDSTECR
jgi:tetratricopeptide (TPR) repeat protein